MHKILTPHECVTVQKQGWGGIKNGELLRLAESAFDLFITSDQNIAYQQNFGGKQIRIIGLSTNNLRRILAAAPLVQSAVATVQLGEYRHVQIP